MSFSLKFLKKKTDPSIWDDVHLPKWIEFYDKCRSKDICCVQEKINKQIFQTSLLPKLRGGSDDAPGAPDDITDKEIEKLLHSVIGKPKPKQGDECDPRPLEWRKIYSKVINHVIREHPDCPEPVEGYLYYGNQDYTKIIPMLCQTNPFWACALTIDEEDCHEYFELIAYHDDHCPLRKRYCQPDEKYLTIMNTMMKNPKRRINVRFNKDMTINRIVTYESGRGKTVCEEDWNYYASGVCYNMGYFASAIHTVLHVFHYLLCTGIVHATCDSPTLKEWANPYDDDIAFKYYQVAAILLHSNVGDNDHKLLTGKYGAGGTEDLLDPLREYLSIWGRQCKDADDFMKKFLLKDIYQSSKNAEHLMKCGGILTEFKKHIRNVEPFACELVKAMKCVCPHDFEKAECKLERYLDACGRAVCKINTINQWLQLMCCTGMVHGATLSYSRLFLMPEVMRWRNTECHYFDKFDIFQMSVVLATTQDMEVEKHVYTSQIKGWKTECVPRDIMCIHEKYDTKADKLKKDYQKALEKKYCLLREYGWLLTDYCPDGYDGKQLTLTTYI